MFKVTGMKVLVKPDKPLEFYDNEQLIVRPDTDKLQGKFGYMINGLVLQVGSECQKEIDDNKWDFKVGDSVLCNRYVGSEIKIDGNDYRVVLPDNVEAVVEG